MCKGTNRSSIFPPFCLALLLSLAGCEPTNTQRYWYPPSDSAAASLGAACDLSRPCPPELVCRVAAECRIDYEADETGDLARESSGALLLLGAGCRPETGCAPGYTCHPVGKKGVCTTDCRLDEDCPGESVCWQAQGPTMGWCIRPNGLAGAPCVYENDCAPGLFCENRARGGYCTKECGVEMPCPRGMNVICTALSGNFGNYCLELCGTGPNGADQTCRGNATCTEMRGAPIEVCFPKF